MALINLHRKYALMCTLRSHFCGRQLYLAHREHHSPSASPEMKNSSAMSLLWFPTFPSMPFQSSTSAVPQQPRRSASPLPTAANRTPQAPNQRRLHPKLLEVARLQAASTQHMSQSKQIVWNFPEHAEGPAAPTSLFLRGRAACGEGDVLWQGAVCCPRAQTCSSAGASADPPHGQQGRTGMGAGKSWKVLSWPGHLAHPVMIGAG